MTDNITDFADRYSTMLRAQVQATQLCDRWALSERVALATLMHELREALRAAPEDAFRLTERVRAALARAEHLDAAARVTERDYRDHVDSAIIGIDNEGDK